MWTSSGTEAILRNLLQPNAAMENAYRIFRVEMKNGDVVDALFVSEEKDAVVIRTFSQRLLVEAGRVGSRTLIVTTVHPVQILPESIEMRAHDEEFLNTCCNGWPELRERLAAVTWEEILEKGGVPREEIEEIANRYARAKNVVFSWTMGITHHAHGVQNVQAIGNLALLRGMVGKPGAGLMPIRGHSNVQGIGSVGVTPQRNGARTRA